MAHKFKIGQSVELKSNILRSLAPTRYEICYLIPASDRASDDPRYLINGTSEKHERAVPESELMLAIAGSTRPCRASAKFSRNIEAGP
jgi:hypothetical protein